MRIPALTRALLDQVNDAVITTDLNGAITGWNAGAERVYGYSALEALGQDMSILSLPEDASATKLRVLDPLETHERDEVIVRYRRKGGEEIIVDLRMSILRDQQGNVVGYIGCSNDITERWRAEEAVRRTKAVLESRLRERTQELKAADARLEAEVAERTQVESNRPSLLENTPGLFYARSHVFPFEGRFISGNVEGVFGDTAEQVLAEPDFWLSRVHPEDVHRAISALSQLQESATTIHEYRFRFRDGSYQWIRDSAVLARGLRGEALEILAYCENISGTRRVGEILVIRNTYGNGAGARHDPAKRASAHLPEAARQP